jgi:hypothetical protein
MKRWYGIVLCLGLGAGVAWLAVQEADIVPASRQLMQDARDRVIQDERAREASDASIAAACAKLTVIKPAACKGRE